MRLLFLVCSFSGLFHHYHQNYLKLFTGQWEPPFVVHLRSIADHYADQYVPLSFGVIWKETIKTITIYHHQGRWSHKSLDDVNKSQIALCFDNKAVDDINIDINIGETTKGRNDRWTNRMTDRRTNRAREYIFRQLPPWQSTKLIFQSNASLEIDSEEEGEKER